jgi:hypothetical protein
VNWNEITAICAVLTILGAIHSFVVLGMVRREISRAIKELNGTYLRTGIFDEYRAGVEQHFDFLRDERRRDHSAR